MGADGGRPFLKWVGGKSQLLAQIAPRLPAAWTSGEIRTYVEPFIGGGAVFLEIARRYPDLRCQLCDINSELVLVWRTVQKDVEGLIDQLQRLQAQYLPLAEADRRRFYYDVRDTFNNGRPAIDFEHFGLPWLERAAQLLFLNRTGYNGLFRVNGRGGFNVPFGRYTNPAICTPDNLRAVAALLRRAEIRCLSFDRCLDWAGPATFVYFDPPYRPLSRTANFTAYSSHGFDDAAQLRLANLCRQLDHHGTRFLLSNSDPHNSDPEDDFFDRAYAGFRLERVQATRMVSCRASERGPVSELLIRNY